MERSFAFAPTTFKGSTTGLKPTDPALARRVGFHGFGALLSAVAVATLALDPLHQNVPVWLWLVLPASAPLMIVAYRARSMDIAREVAETPTEDDEEGTQRPQAALDGAGRRRRAPRPVRWGPVAGVLFWALLMRLPLLASAPALSDDVFRYVWEGRVTAAGGDPYDESPMDPGLADLITDAPEWASINHRELPAIYPPGTQWVFAGIASMGADPTTFRAAMVGFDLLLILGICLLLQLRGLPTRRAVLYAWHPLVVVEVSGSGHYEPLALLPLIGALLAWTLRRPLLAYALWGVAFATKYVGAGAALFAARSQLGRNHAMQAAFGLTLLALIAAIPAVPFALDGTLPVGSLGTYAKDWAHNSSVHALLSTYIGFHPARLVAGGLFLLWTGKLLAREQEPARGFFLLFVGLILFSPVVHPWYALWVIVLLPLFPSTSVTLFSVLLPLSYLAWTSAIGGQGWVLPGWVPWLEYGLPVLVYRLWER